MPVEAPVTMANGSELGMRNLLAAAFNREQTQTFLFDNTVE
jgi:hypothetical protein